MDNPGLLLGRGFPCKFMNLNKKTLLMTLPNCKNRELFSSPSP